MINMFFVTEKWSQLADPQPVMLSRIKEVLLQQNMAREVTVPDKADVILLQEKVSYKDFRYIAKLLNDPIVSRHTEKVFTINCDDCATGLLRGLYTSLPKSRFDSKIHCAMPYMQYPNELIFDNTHCNNVPEYMASWRGNTKSNTIRCTLTRLFHAKPGYNMQTTDSWLDHNVNEKEVYKNLILNAKFSLCPAGWAPVTFRIYESMALGRCPVILADQFVPPSGPDWNKFALFLPEKKLPELDSFLRLHEPLYKELGAHALSVWQRYFNQTHVANYFADGLMKLIASAPPTTQALEFKRWSSFGSYWNNNWTLPQRVINRARKWSKIINHKIQAH